MIAWIIAGLLVLFGLGYFVYAAWNLVRGYWKRLAALGEEVGRSSEKLAGIEAPEIPAVPEQTALEIKRRVRETRHSGKAKRLARTIGRWSGEMSD